MIQKFEVHVYSIGKSSLVFFAMGGASLFYFFGISRWERGLLGQVYSGKDIGATMIIVICIYIDIRRHH